MAFMDANAPRRALDTCAKNTWYSKIWQHLLLHWHQRHHPGPPHMNPHIARDIGLSDIELARQQHQWPSETTHHPRG